MMKNNSLLFLALLAIGCYGGDGRCDEDNYVVNKLSQDIEIVANRLSDLSPNAEEKAFLSYERIAIIIEDGCDLDAISHDFHEKLINSDTLAYRTEMWKERFSDLRCTLYKSKIDSLFEQINFQREVQVDTKRYRIDQLRSLNGLSSDDSSMDSVLYSNMNESRNVHLVSWE